MNEWMNECRRIRRPSQLSEWAITHAQWKVFADPNDWMRLRRPSQPAESATAHAQWKGFAALRTSTVGGSWTVWRRPWTKTSVRKPVCLQGQCKKGQDSERSRRKTDGRRLGTHQGRGWSEEEKLPLRPSLKNNINQGKTDKGKKLGSRFRSY